MTSVRTYVLVVLLLLVAASGAGGSVSPERPATRAAVLADSPSFLVQPRGGNFVPNSSELDLSLDFSASTRPPARITIDVPAGFQLYLDRYVGSRVGTARIVAADFSTGSTTFAELAAAIVSAPLDPTAEAAAQACSPGSHLAVWLLRLSLLGQPLELPIYFSPVNSSDPPETFVKLDLCPPSLAPSSPVRGPLLPIVQINLALPDLEPPAARGDYLWRAIVTPLAPDRTTPLIDQAYELRSRVSVPNRLTLRGRYLRAAHTATLTGTFRTGNHQRAHVPITLVRLDRVLTRQGVVFRDRVVAVTRTSRTGAYSFQVKLRKTVGFYTIAASTTTACVGPSSAPAGCVNTTAPATESDPITVSIK